MTAKGTPPFLRTREIEQVSNFYFIHPISRWFVDRFEALGIHPNVVSISGMSFGAAAAVAYYHYDRLPMVVLGFALMIGWHVMDGADGQLARKTGKTSEIGKVLDGLCDYMTFMLVYSSLCLRLMPAWGYWIWLIGGAAAASHVMQANVFEFQRQAYDYRVHGKSSARLITVEEYREGLSRKEGLVRFFATIYLPIVQVQEKMIRIDHRLHQRLDDLQVEGGRADLVAASYRENNLSAVRQWGVLSSNTRTVALFIACLAGNPLYFLGFEILVLNGVLLGLMARQRQRNEALYEELAPTQMVEVSALP